MLWEEVDVVGNDHQVANLKGWVHTTCCIRHEEGLDAQFVHHANGERYFLHVIAFIVVEATLHGHDVNATQFTEDKFARMAFYGRYREVGDFFVGKLQLVSYLGS